MNNSLVNIKNIPIKRLTAVAPNNRKQSKNASNNNFQWEVK